MMQHSPPDDYAKLREWLEGIPARLPSKPKAILMVSAHWEEPEFTLLETPEPKLRYDYFGFPKATYELNYPAPLSSHLNSRIKQCFAEAQQKLAGEFSRDYDHGVFVPLMVMFPEADIPIAQLSLKSGLDPTEHIRIGKLLAQLRREEVLIIGSGLSYHNLRLFGPQARRPSAEFDEWLTNTLCNQTDEPRNQALTNWKSAPSATICHPREEHLTPLNVIVGSANEAKGIKTYSGKLYEATISGFEFA